MNTSVASDIQLVVPESLGRAGAREFLNELSARLDEGVGVVTLDCGQLKRVTSQDVRILWLAREQCSESGAELHLANVGRGLRRVLEALDLIDLFIPNAGSPAPLTLTIAAGEAEIDNAMSVLVAHLLQSRVPEITVFEIQTMFYEVATNLRRHAGLADPATFEFTVRIETGSVELTFVDAGRYFDPLASKPMAGIREAGALGHRHGFGIEMIKRLSTNMTYKRRSDERNELTITKVW